MSVASDSPMDVNQQDSHGEYLRAERWQDATDRKHEEWRDELEKKMRHKALNIPIGRARETDDVNVDNRRTWTGIGWKELAVLGGLGLGGLGIFKFSDREEPPSPPPAAAEDVSQEFDVTIYQKNADGTFTPFTMPRLPESAQIKP